MSLDSHIELGKGSCGQRRVGGMRIGRIGDFADCKVGKTVDSIGSPCSPGCKRKDCQRAMRLLAA